MKRKIGVAASLALIAFGAFASSALAQCETGFYIKFDADAFAFEDTYTPATFNSASGSQLVVVGIVSEFCSPFLDLDATDPSKEFTFIFAGLTSQGTVATLVAPGTTRYQTDYGQGVFIIYEDTPRDAPTSAGGMPPNPPVAGQVPDRFVDGTKILEGSLLNFVTTVTKFANGNHATSFRADYQFTGPVGGTYYTRVSGNLQDRLGGTWCAAGTANGLCAIPAGYSSHPNGKFDGPPVTATRPSTWGAVKQLYR